MEVKLGTSACDGPVFIFTLQPLYPQPKSISMHWIRVEMGSGRNVDTVVAKTFGDYDAGVDEIETELEPEPKPQTEGGSRTVTLLPRVLSAPSR